MEAIRVDHVLASRLVSSLAGGTVWHDHVRALAGIIERGESMIEALVGAAVGVLTIFLARIIHAERWVYSIGLLSLPSLYALFALHAGEQASGAREMLYGMPFLIAGLAFTVVSVRYSAVAVGAFWILHGLYDLVHGSLLTNPGVPAWYPVWCCAVDVVIGGYVFWLSRRITDGNLRLA